MISFRKFSKAVAFGLLVAVVLLPTTAVASTASSGLVLVRESDIVGEDLYASGNRIVVRGVIQGDLVAAAFESIVIEGTVEGNVIAVAGSVTVSGDVGGSVRVVADVVTISGSVGGDVVALARNLDIEGQVPRDILAALGSLSVSGSVGRDIRVAAWGENRISGVVGRDVESNSDRLTISDGASIGGDVRYRGTAQFGDFQADGTVIALGSPPTPVRVQALAILGIVLALLGLLSLGFLSFWVTPRTAQLAIAKVGGFRWVTSGLVGALALVVPLATYLLFVVGAGIASPDLAAPAGAFASPLLAMYLLIVSLGLLVGVVPLATALGAALLKRRSAFAHYVAGLMVLVVGLGALATWSTPWLAVLVAAGILTVGVGAWLRGAWSARGSMAWVDPTSNQANVVI